MDYLQTPPKNEEKLNQIPKKMFKNDDVYDLFYKEKTQNQAKIDLLSLNRPNSMKESYNDLKENEKNRRFMYKNSNKKTLEKVGQEVLNQITAINEEKEDKFKENGIKEEKINQNNLYDEVKNKNIYDSFNQRLEHLDKMKKKYEIHRNFDEKQMITKYSEPLYRYNDDLEKYKKALEKRVLAAKNNVFDSFFFKNDWIFKIFFR